MISQFSPEGNKATLAELFQFPKDVYPVGRLDSDSEGLLLLTNDKKLNHRLLDPKFGHNRTYFVQVDGQVSDEALLLLEQGVPIKVDNRIYHTRPARAEAISEPELPERNPPVRFRKSIPTSWIRLILEEGKNRQVRKMTAQVGFPTLRLIRAGIEDLALGDMKPGEVLELGEKETYTLLHIKHWG